MGFILGGKLTKDAKHRSLWTECALQNSYVEATPHCVTVFGDGAFKELITVKGGHKHGALIQ